MMLLLRAFAALAAISAAPAAGASLTFELNGTAGEPYVELLRDQITSEWIGEKYQTIVTDPASGSVVGVLQGFAFNFDNETSFNDNGVLYFVDGDSVTLLDNYIAGATGKYESYAGGHVDENIISFDPYVSVWTMYEPSEEQILAKDEDAADAGNYSFRITSEGGY